MNEPTPISEQAKMVEFLRRDPDFFKRHPGLLAELNLPHQAGSATSLVERQVALLRERNIDMRRRMNELVASARDNDVLFAKIRSLTLALLDVASWHELNEIFATYFLVDFHADFVCCHLHSSGPRSLQREATGLTLNHIHPNADGLPEPHLQPQDGPCCVTLRREELDSLFPGQTKDAGDNGSAVLIPLNIGPDACLAVGSRDAGHFSADQDTLFVEYIADVSSHVVARLMR